MLIKDRTQKEVLVFEKKVNFDVMERTMCEQSSAYIKQDN